MPSNRWLADRLAALGIFVLLAVGQYGSLQAYRHAQATVQMMGEMATTNPLWYDLATAVVVIVVGGVYVAVRDVLIDSSPRADPLEETSGPTDRRRADRWPTVGNIAVQVGSFGHRRSLKWLATMVVLSLGPLRFLFAWGTQIRSGLLVSGLGDWKSAGGIPWEIYIGTFIWWVGIAHGGIAISAAVRVFKIESFASG